MEGAALQKAHERLALHELLRIGLGRQEDLRLLQNVGQEPVQPCSLSHTMGAYAGMPGTKHPTPPLRLFR